MHWLFPPALGVYFQRPLSHSVRWGSIFSDPYRILCFGVSKTHGKVLRCDFLRHLAPHVGHLARLVGHLGANMSHKCSQDARKMPSWSQHRQKSASATSSSTPKYQKKLCFPLVFVGFLLSSPCAKIVPKCSQHAPKTSQVEPKIAILALSWPILVATCCQLSPNFAHLAPIFAPTCAEIFRKSRAPRQKLPQDLTGLLQDQIFESPPPPRRPKI